jgi:hypothetical protein
MCNSVDLQEFGSGRLAPANYKELFNLRHSILRAGHIERAFPHHIQSDDLICARVGCFGRLKRRWRIVSQTVTGTRAHIFNLIRTCFLVRIGVSR